MRHRLMIPVLFLLAACGSEPADKTVGTDIARDYNEVLDEAAAVEDQVGAAKARVDAALEHSDGAGD